MTINLLFVLTALIFVICVILGFKRGFVKEVSILLSTVAAILIAILLLNPASAWVNEHTQIDDKIAGTISLKITSLLPAGVTAEMTSDLSLLQKAELLERAPLPETIKNKLIENNHASVYEALGISNFVDYISKYLALVITRILTFVVIFLVLTILMRLILMLMNGASKMPLLRGINRIAGAFISVLVFLVMVWLFFLVITVFCTTAWGNSLLAMVEENSILKFLYDHNFLFSFLTRG